MNILKLTSLSALSLGLLVACSKPLPEQPPDVELDYRDVGVDAIYPVRSNEVPKVKALSGQVATEYLFEHVQRMQLLGEGSRESKWAADSQERFLSFYSHGELVSDEKFGATPYAEFLVANSQTEFMEATKGLNEFFATQREKVSAAIKAAQNGTPVLTGNVGAVQIVNYLTSFMENFERSLGVVGLEPAIRDGIQAGIYKNFWLRLDELQPAVQQLDTIDDFEQLIQLVQNLAKDLEIEIDQDISGRLSAASGIGQMLNQEKMTPAQLFAVLVDFWNQMSPEDRKENFGKVSPQLYSFLEKKDHRQLQCLRDNNCKGLFLKLTQRFFILPRLKKQGVESIRASVESAAIKSVRGLMSEKALVALNAVPEILYEQIAKEMDVELARFQGYRANYPAFVRAEVQDWFEKEFGRTTLPALEHRLVNVDTLERQHLTSDDIGSGDIETSADAMGAALAANEQLFKKPRAQTLKSSLLPAQLLGLTRINQLLAHGGFRKVDGQPFPSLSRRIGQLGYWEPLNIQGDFEFPGLFTMPSPVRVQRGFQVPRDAVAQDFNIRSQARLLRGFAKMMESFKDWTKAPMDDLLGNVQAKDLLPSLPSEDLAIPAFPKDAFIAVAFGNASAVLTNLKAKGSPLFLKCHDGKDAWSDEKYDCATATGKAGLVHITGGTRSLNVETLAQAEFLSALVQFLKTGENMLQNTKSQYLLKTSDGAIAPVETFRKSLPDLRGLAIALTNFITGELQNDDGSFAISFNRVARTKSKKTLGYEAHLVVLDALADSISHFNLPPFKRAAVRSYNYLNREFYNSKTQFYGDGATPTTAQLSEALIVLPKVMPFLGSKPSKDQLSARLRLWSKALLPYEI